MSDHLHITRESIQGVTCYRARVGGWSLWSDCPLKAAWLIYRTVRRCGRLTRHMMEN